MITIETADRTAHHRAMISRLLHKCDICATFIHRTKATNYGNHLAKLELARNWDRAAHHQRELELLTMVEADR